MLRAASTPWVLLLLATPSTAFQGRPQPTLPPSAPTPSATATLARSTFAWADYDRDGNLDAYVVLDGSGSLLRADGEGGFTNATEAAGLAPLPPTRFALWGDFDGDGAPDLFVGAAEKGSRLYRNGGNGSDWAAGFP